MRIFRKSTESFQNSHTIEFQGAKKPQLISQVTKCFSLNLDQNINLSAGKDEEFYQQKKFKSSENYDSTSQERKLEISHSMKRLSSIIIRRLIKGKRKEIS